MSEGDLSVQATELTEATTKLAESVQVLATRQSRLRRLVWAMVAAVALILCLVGAVVVLFLNQRATSDRVAANTAHVTQIVAGRTVLANSLCPLYAVYLHTYSETERAALPPAEQAKYDHGFTLVRAGWTALGCT